MAITGMDLRKACAAVCAEARAGGWKYGDSQTLPPCADKTISCDRMIARALYNLGYKNQPKGGITVMNMEKYLLSWGFKKITNANDITHGDIILMKADGTTSPTAAWHTFLCDQFWGVNKIWKYDCGSQTRIQTAQPFVNVPLDEWNNKSFYCAFRVPSSSTSPSTTTTTNSKPKGTDAKVAAGIYKICSAINNNFVVDVTGASYKDGANIQLYANNGSAAQAFYIYPLGNESYLIGNVNSGKMIDVPGGNTASGTNAQQYVANGTKAQKYWIQSTADGNCVIYSQVSGMALDVAGAAASNGTNILFYTPNGTNAQKWKLVKV